MVVTNGALAYIFNVFFLLVYIYFLNIIKYLCKVSYKLCNLPLPLGGCVCVCVERSPPPQWDEEMLWQAMGQVPGEFPCALCTSSLTPEVERKEGGVG